jgi:peptide deformylase
MKLSISDISRMGSRPRKILDWRVISRKPYTPLSILPRVKPAMPPERVIEKLPEELKTLCGQMATSCLLGDGIGLAAPQIGTNIAIITILNNDQREFEFYFNPDWLPVEDNKTKKAAIEACLSVPGKQFPINRFEEIEARWYSYQELGDGNKGEFVFVQKILRGFEARVFQHEVDHLYGRSIVDRYKQAKTNGG